uniref:Uncharacterized protein n=1 Tax=Lygus hesperus TaxID=30085 RepID=A0A0K8TCS4_LYGHE
MQTLKKMLLENSDPTLALLEYRTTPGPSGYSPEELLMERKLRTRVPVLLAQLQPRSIDHESFKKWDECYRYEQADYYNLRHRTRNEPSLNIGSAVYIPDRKEEGTVVEKVAPRSYSIVTKDGEVRRNILMLRLLPRARREDVSPPRADQVSTTRHRTSSGRVTQPPFRLNL